MRLLPHLMFETPLADVIDHWRGAFPALSARIVRPGEGGKVLMPLDAYDFSPRFLWLNERLGVSWQIMQAPQ